MANTLFINGKECEYTDEPNLLEVIRKNGFNVPTFCYRPDLTQFGACRMCVVEIEGRGIQSSCTMPPEPGLKIHTNTEKTRRIRKVVLELLLANHDRECTTCSKSGNCELQQYAQEYGITDIRFAKKKEEDYLPIDDSNPSIVRDPNKCILCGDCVRTCEEIQGLGILNFAQEEIRFIVFAPRSPKSAASGAYPIPTESSTMRKTLFAFIVFLLFRIFLSFGEVSAVGRWGN